LNGMRESSVLLSSVVRVIHPQLFQMGMEAMRRLGLRADLSDVVELWYCIFNGASVISNRETPMHRDNFSRCQWYDLLTTVGPYQEAILELPGVGLRFKYASGTVVGLCGRILRHGVSDADGERICVAHYMRENVQRRLNTEMAGWNTWDFYKD
jgi:hypothetical protein